MLTTRDGAGSGPGRVLAVGDPAHPPTLKQVEAAARGRTAVALHSGALERARASDAALDRLVADRRAIHGVTTGFGPLADRQVDPRRGGEIEAVATDPLDGAIGSRARGHAR